MNKGHWTGIEPDHYNSFGFIYLITDHTTGRKYIGKKGYWKARQVYGCKGKVMDRRSKKWKMKCWSVSDWPTYKGSSQTLKDHMKKYPDHEYTFEILRNVPSKTLLTYWETKEQWNRDVLTAKLPDGTFEYFNQSVSAIRFRPMLEEE